MTTAYLDEAERCNRVGLMHKGKLIRCSAPDVMKQETGSANLEGAFIKTIHLVGRTGGAAMNGNGWGVEIHDMVKTFGSFMARRPRVLQVRKGEIFGFLGPNGAGKSPPSACSAPADAHLRGRLPSTGSTWPPSRRKSAGISATCRRNSRSTTTSRWKRTSISSPACTVLPQGVARRTQAIRARNGQPHRPPRCHDPHALRRLETAAGAGCAILHDPPISFLDEPTSGVDHSRGALSGISSTTFPRPATPFRQHALHGRSRILSPHSR